MDLFLALIALFLALTDSASDSSAAQAKIQHSCKMRHFIDNKVGKTILLNFFLQKIAKIFGGFNKKSYLCTRF